MNSVWNAATGGFTPDWDRIKTGLYPYYADLWQSRTPEECALLIQLAADKTAKENSRLLELRQRGLITKENKLFCSAFAELISNEWLPQSIFG
ncbi:MAG: hypothetical protein GY862_34055 [Gammaproteobacteria bacterium]|nr:hypothetical protein [Gammaproteobacteria bacterium]